MISFSENLFSNPSYSFTFTHEIEKMEKGELTLEDILSNNDLVHDLKTNPKSSFISFLTYDIIIKLIDYSLKIPKSNEHTIGYQFPFNATEILCSNTKEIQDKIMNETKDINKNNNNNKDNEENKQNLININNYSNENDSNESKVLKEEKNIKDDNNINSDINKIKIEKENIIENKMNYNIINYLFDFLKESNSENNSNYVLIGYFNKILNNLIDNQSKKIIDYIYDYPDKKEYVT